MARTSTSPWLLVGCLLAPLIVSSCGGESAPPGDATSLTENDVPLIPRELLFGNPERANPALSPDGRHLAFRAPVDGVMNVWVAPAEDMAAARPVTKDATRGIQQYLWASTSNHIVYLQDTGGDENWRVHSVDLTTGATRDLTPIAKVAARIQAVSDKFPNEILVSLNDRDPQFHDIHRIDIVTGRRTLVQRNDRFVGFVTDTDFNVRLALQFRPDGGADLFRRTDAGAFEPFEQIGPDDTLTTQPIGFSRDGKTLYLIDSRNRDTAAVFGRDFPTGRQTLLAEDSRSDAQGGLTHPRDRTIQAIAFNYDRTRWQVLDPAIAEDLEYLQGVTDGEIGVSSRTLDDTRWIVSYAKDDGPVRYYLYERPARRATLLFSSRPSLEGTTLARMHPREITSRDGLTLMSYLTLPPWSDGDGDGRPSSPQPMVLLVHGGPWGRDAWGYNAIHQLLANRGYAVLSVNFRGSTGFGKSFTNAGNLEWAGRMHDDLIDGVNWAVAEKVADPARVAIMGGSYGGYATLVGLTFTPDVFAAGVDIVGPSNLVTLLSTIPPYWTPQINLFTTRVGDHRTDEGRKLLESRSPLNRVDRIVKPLLIAQGANDPRVKQAESDQIVKAMQGRKIPVTYALFPDEGHGFARPENNIAFMAVAEAFLARHLGGRTEPMGSAFDGSSITVPEGRELIAGLDAALAKKQAGTSSPGSPSP